MSRRKQTKPQHLLGDNVESASDISEKKSCQTDTCASQHIEEEVNQQSVLRSDHSIDLPSANRTCHYCGVVRNSPADLRRHLRKHTGERPFSCSICQRAFKAKRSLQYHQYMHHGIQFKGNNDYVEVTDLTEADPQLSPASVGENSIHSPSEMRDTSGGLSETMPADNLDHSSFPVGSGHLEPGIQSNGGNRQYEEGFSTYSDDRLISHPNSLTANLLYQGKVGSPEQDEMDEKYNSLLSKRTCQFCSKVCPKPSDLKRHLMVHTGERPFKCDVCGKGFKAKGSMQYHQKAAHGLDIELSQGLEERYMRLKHRSCLPQNQKEPFNLFMDNSSTNSDTISNKSFPAAEDGPSLSSALPTDEQVPENSEKIAKQRDISKSEVIEKEDSGNGKDQQETVSVEENPTVNEETRFVKNRISIKNETVLVTRLDGVNLISGLETSLFKCHMCGKMFNYLSRLQCHLSVHFERHLTTYQCSRCDANFKFKTQLFRHSRFHTKLSGLDCLHSKSLLGKNCPLEPKRKYSTTSECGDEGDVNPADVQMDVDQSSEKADKSSSSNCMKVIKRPPGKHHKVNGCYFCWFCKKPFFRLFSLQRHERMHTGVKPCYCKECGKGFSEPRNLRQHILRFHNEGFQMDFVRRARKRAIIASLRSSARAMRTEKGKDDEQLEAGCISGAVNSTEMESTTPSDKLSSQDQRHEIEDDDITVVQPAEVPTDLRQNLRAKCWSEDEAEAKEIMAAPKRPLLSFRKDSFGCKSRRKSTVPVKIENMSPPHQPDVFESKVESSKMTIKEEAVSPVPSSEASVSPVLFSNNLGLSQPPTHPLFLSSHLMPTSGLSVNPVMSIPITVQVPLEGASPTPSATNMGLMAQVSPNDFLVGYPRVKWEGNPLAGIPSPEPINRRRSLDSGYNLHSTFTSDKNGVSSDGRKVTSLSRTHSRLHVVNAPVNREKVCKPMLLPDGRSIYRCVFCNKDFPTYSDINRHMDFHEDIRPYKCKFCDYYARTNSQLKVHMMRHQGIREFCCKLCNYKGVTQSDLNRHMKSQIHMLKSRNECPHCREGFVTPKNLERHILEICQAKNRTEKAS